MFAKNLITLCGILTEDVVLQKTNKSKRLVTTVRISIEQEEVDKSGKHINFLVKCVAWDKQAKILATFKKGQNIRIFGELVKTENKYGHERINIKIELLEPLRLEETKIT